MQINEPEISFVIFIKKLLRGYNSIKTRIKNKYFQHVYRFENYNCAIVNSYDDIANFKNKNKKISEECTELNIMNLNGIIKEGKKRGWCSCCNEKTDFIWQLLSKYSDNILFTETFYCSKCGMPNRIRAIIHLFKIFEKSNPKDKKIYCYERNTGFFEYLKSNYGKNNEVIGSEYFGADKKPGEIVNGTRHEDCIFQ